MWRCRDASISTAPPSADAITQYFQTAGRASLLDFLGFPEWFPRPGELLAGSSVRTMHGMVAAAIEARRKESTGKADDLLDHMLAAEDPETGHRMNAARPDPQHAVLHRRGP